MKDDLFFTPPTALLDSPYTPTTDSLIGLSSAASDPLPLTRSTSTAEPTRGVSAHTGTGTCGPEDDFMFSLANPIYDTFTDPDSWGSLFETPIVVATPPVHGSTTDSTHRRTQSTSAATTGFPSTLFSGVPLETKFLREKRSAIVMSGVPEEQPKAEDILKSVKAFTDDEPRPVKRFKAAATFNMLSSASVKPSPATTLKELPPIIVKDPTDRKAMRRARNTLAARRSRDKKKEHLQSLEDRIAELERKNEQLYQENQYLKNQQGISTD
ncbi:hypothetical protein D0Z00_000598 [Geotrichum galactomycetum]|uniref:Uncharacterized protein n=1 Tax=Geotrichum galactomycetum TaxID=27317 RepID=A0ACB6V9H5_9ASCO|nr:hypothetical protein D0Z00_000598 [Geotrichum candidum]